MATRRAGTFDLGRVYRALGVRSTSVNPDLDTANLIQTIQVADMSKSFAPEAFEARAVGALAGASGPIRTYEVKAIAPGGIVIEIFRVVQPAAITLGVVVTIQSTTRMAGVTTVAAGKLDVGGVPTTSTVEQDAAAPLAVPVGASGPIKLVGDSSDVILFNPISWFVPASFFLTLTSFGLIDLEDVDIQWREIPQPQGEQ